MCGNPGAHSPGAKNCNFIYVLHANTLPNDIGHGAITKDFQLSIPNWQLEIQCGLEMTRKMPRKHNRRVPINWGEDGNGTRLITLIQC